jgi:hypothetical protein
MRRLVALAAVLVVTPAVHAVDVVLGGRAVTPIGEAASTPWVSCAPRHALAAGTRLGAPSAPSLSMTPVYVVEVPPPARGRVVSLAYPGIPSREQTVRYAYAPRGTTMAATASACAWTGAASRPGS